MEKSIYKVDPTVLSKYAGKYRDVEYPEYGAEIIKDGDKLFYCEKPGDLQYQIYPDSETEFFSIHRPESIKFVANDGDKVEMILIGQFVQLKREE